uniref:Uncharacterized protein LOC102807692 n=1 Tax=Saccoglossus kowalevskii TaxID=10224 RepID=A0ABM0MDW3_SACKO|nr:PREDICTED: uncharacterized protein LOC102807692 [Saccoglossus kowalevskii]
MDSLPSTSDRLTVRRSLVRPKRQRITLCFGVSQIFLGLLIVAVSFAAFGLSTSNRVRNACPYWAGFSISFFTFLSAVCVILHLVATVLSGETGSLLKSFLMCMRHDVQNTCLCCDTTYECGLNYIHKAVLFEGVLNCDMVSSILKELMYTICVINVIACLLSFIATILGCANIVKRNSGRRFILGQFRPTSEHIDAASIGEVIDSVFTPPVPPPPYSPPEYGEISGDPIMVEAGVFVEEVGTDAANAHELPPPYCILDVSPDSAFEHLTSEASPMEPLQIEADETSGLESCQSPITPGENYCRIYVNPADMDSFTHESIRSGLMPQLYTTGTNARKQTFTECLPKKTLYSKKCGMEVCPLQRITTTVTVEAANPMYRLNNNSDMENNNLQLRHSSAGDSEKCLSIAKVRDSVTSSTLSNQTISEVGNITCSIGETVIDNYVTSNYSASNDSERESVCQTTVEIHSTHVSPCNIHVPLSVKTYNVKSSGRPSSSRSFHSISAPLSSDSDSYEDYIHETQSKSYPRTKKQRQREMHARRRRERRISESRLSSSSGNSECSHNSLCKKSCDKKQKGSVASFGIPKSHNSTDSVSFKSVDVSSPTRLSVTSNSSKSGNSLHSLSSTVHSNEALELHQEKHTDSDIESGKPQRPSSLEIKPVHNLPAPNVLNKVSPSSPNPPERMLVLPGQIHRRYAPLCKPPKLPERCACKASKKKTKPKQRPKSLADFKSFKDAKILVAKFIDQSNGTMSPAVKNVLENIQCMIKSDEKHLAEAIHSANVIGHYTRPVSQVTKLDGIPCENYDSKDSLYKSSTSLGSRYWNSCSELTALSDHTDDEITDQAEDFVKTLTICKETVL